MGVRRAGERGRLSEAAEKLLFASLAPGALEFARATTLQAAHRLGAPPPSGDDELQIARNVVHLVTSAVNGLPYGADTTDEQRQTLTSAAFQNLDLLYQSNFPQADAVSALIMHLIWSPDRH